MRRDKADIPEHDAPEVLRQCKHSWRRDDAVRDRQRSYGIEIAAIRHADQESAFPSVALAIADTHRIDAKFVGTSIRRIQPHQGQAIEATVGNGDSRDAPVVAFGAVQRNGIISGRKIAVRDLDVVRRSIEVEPIRAQSPAF